MKGWSQCSVLSGSGKRLIINHIGSEDGFLEGVGECFVGKKDNADYHQEMNAVSNNGGAVFSGRPELPNKSVVIDNAKYHSRQTEESRTPTTACRLGQIRDWLPSKGKPFDAKDTQLILLGKSREIFV